MKFSPEMKKKRSFFLHKAIFCQIFEVKPNTQKEPLRTQEKMTLVIEIHDQFSPTWS